MEGTKGKTPINLKPPYGNVAWYKLFFDLLRRRAFERFDKEIIEYNIIKGSNATMLFRGLRFLGLVEKDGKVTEKFESLRRKGEEFKQNLKKIVEEGYSHLFSVIVVEKAKPEDLFNYFAQYHNYSESTAGLSAKIFTYLCKSAGIPISEELSALEFKPKKVKKEERAPKRRIRGRKMKEGIPVALERMQKIEYGDSILMFLGKGDRSTREKIAKTAKKFIDIYVEEEESETEK